jgi:tRNA threonylcarbamoyladenosine biosynthesis protein TsaB
MKILALETSTDTASLALLCDGVLSSVSFSSPPAHSATVLPALGRLLAESGLSLTQLDVIACGMGPGSFTGVRLACSITQGLSLGADLPVAPVSCLMALAQAAQGEKAYCTMDARMREVYVAAYWRKNGTWHEEISPCCVPPDAIPVPAGTGWVCAGNAMAVYPTLATRLGAGVLADDTVSVPTAKAIAELAGQMDWVDAAKLAPVYVRDRVAFTVAERLASGGKA